MAGPSISKGSQVSRAWIRAAPRLAGHAELGFFDRPGPFRCRLKRLHSAVAGLRTNCREAFSRVNCMRAPDRITAYSLLACYTLPKRTVLRNLKRLAQVGCRGWRSTNPSPVTRAATGGKSCGSSAIKSLFIRWAGGICWRQVTRITYRRSLSRLRPQEPAW